MSEIHNTAENELSSGIRLIHRELYEAAILNHYFFMQRTMHLMEKRCAETQKDEHPIECTHAMTTAAFGTILFTAISLEALINFYAKKLNIHYSSDLEQTLSTLNKWRIYPKLGHGTEIPEHVLQRVKLVFKLRDRVAHPKSRTENAPKNVRLFTPCESAYLINTIHAAARSLDKSGNPDPSGQWIKKDFPHPLAPDVDIYF